MAVKVRSENRRWAIQRNFARFEMRDRGDRAKVGASRVTTRTRRVTKNEPAEREMATITTSRTRSTSMEFPEVDRLVPGQEQCARSPAGARDDCDVDPAGHTVAGRTVPGRTGTGRRSRPVGWQQHPCGPVGKGQILRFTPRTLSRAGFAGAGSRIVGQPEIRRCGTAPGTRRPGNCFPRPVD